MTGLLGAVGIPAPSTPVVVAGRPVPRGRDGITVFKSTGHAALDVAAASVVYTHAGPTARPPRRRLTP